MSGKIFALSLSFVDRCHLIWHVKINLKKHINSVNIDATKSSVCTVRWDWRLNISLHSKSCTIFQKFCCVWGREPLLWQILGPLLKIRKRKKDRKVWMLCKHKQNVSRVNLQPFMTFLSIFLIFFLLCLCLPVPAVCFATFRSSLFALNTTLPRVLSGPYMQNWWPGAGFYKSDLLPLKASKDYQLVRMSTSPKLQERGMQTCVWSEICLFVSVSWRTAS